MKSFIKPSGEYKNALDFLNHIRIPFVDDIEIELYDDSNIDKALVEADADYEFKLCFKSSYYITSAFIVLLFVIGFYLE
jgi:hypothetical protein